MSFIFFNIMTIYMYVQTITLIRMYTVYKLIQLHVRTMLNGCSIFALTLVAIMAI